VRVPSPKETVTSFGEILTTGAGRERAKPVRGSLRSSIKPESAEEKDSRAETPAWAEYDTRRLGLHALCPLTGVVETEVLGLRVKPTCASARCARGGS
jgi:hypothetical protein